jgi:hypothetical protein
MKCLFTYQSKMLTTIIMLIALTWLTIGTSFIYLNQSNEVTKINAANKDPEQNSCPFDTEESENRCLTFADEFLTEDVDDVVCIDKPLKHYKSHYGDAFVLFHGESFSPPPEVVS